MAPEVLEGIRRMVDDWPPVTTETYARLALLLAPEPAPAAEFAPERPRPAHSAAA